jgi:hypothetical protein
VVLEILWVLRAIKEKVSLTCAESELAGALVAAFQASSRIDLVVFSVDVLICKCGFINFTFRSPTRISRKK